MRVRLMSPAEHLLDVCRSFRRQSNARPVVPERIPHIPVLIQSFVNHIPRDDLTCVMLHHPDDVFVQKPRELPGCEMTLGEPVRVVSAPYQAVAAYLHLMAFRKGTQLA